MNAATATSPARWLLLETTTKSDKFHSMTFRLICFLSIFLTLHSNAQTGKRPKGNFKFWIASLVNDTAHKVVTYYLTSDSIIVKKGADWNFSKADTILFVSKFTNQEQVDIAKIVTTIKRQTFKSFYYNPCIIHGTSVEFSFRWADLTKRTTLANYYLKEVDPLLHFINKIVPAKHQIPYDKTKLENDIKTCGGAK